ncbi:hypothetical protein CF65_02912 [Aggregatibacter actinomycetemcomitans HK1651]|nr:hypothetical protein CF65_02912 [Aggregatibacter actinomycetemcomitans HK1651]
MMVFSLIFVYLLPRLQNSARIIAYRAMGLNVAENIRRIMITTLLKIPIRAIITSIFKLQKTLKNKYVIIDGI